MTHRFDFLSALGLSRIWRRGALVAVLAGAFAAAACGGTRQGLSSAPNLGPCPLAVVLYDASRLVDISGDETFQNVGFTGEIQKVQSNCRYTDDLPIRLNMAVDFAFGRGPAAEGRQYTYRYWVAVTRKDSTVIEKQYFEMPVRFSGEDRAKRRDEIGPIIIPRADETISGANFEVLVGFDLTPEQLAFNRSGKRFRVNAGSGS